MLEVINKIDNINTDIDAVVDNAISIETLFNEIEHSRISERYSLQIVDNETDSINDWPRLKRAQVAKLIGKTEPTIQKLHTNNKMALPCITNQNNKQQFVGYDYNEIQEIRDLLRANPDKLDCKIITVANQKGGVSKSTTTQHFAHFLAIKGYKVLVMDTDQQCSTTEFFLDSLKDYDNYETLFATLYAFYNIEEVEEKIGKINLTRLDHCIHKTKWTNIDIVPCSDDFNRISRVLYSYAASEGFPLASFNNIVNKLRMIIKSHSEYDFVIIDSPPSLDNIPELMIRVADYVFTPVISQLPVYRSTLKFYKNISQIYNQEKELIEVLDRMNSNIPVDSEYSADDLQLINDICTRIGVDSIVKHVPRLITFVTKFGSDKAHKIIKDAYIDAIGQSTENGITLLSSIINDSRAINEASVENNSVYEAIPSRSRAKILKQTKENLDELYSEFLNLIICEHNHE